MQHRVVAMGTCLTAGLFSFGTKAELPAPYLHLSFDRGFQIEGTGAKGLNNFPDSPFPGVVKAPAGEFVAGVFGKAFIPGEDLIIQGEGVLPAPEGTISLWIKPVKYEEDWLGGPLLTPGRIGSFLTGTMRDANGEAPFSLQVRLYRHDCCSGLHWVEHWAWPAQTFLQTGPNPPFNIWQKDKWRMLTVVWSPNERRIYVDGVLIQHGTADPSNKVDYIAASSDYTKSGTGTTVITRNPTVKGNELTIPAGSKAVDEFMVWDTPLTDAQVAALFFAHLPESGLRGSVQQIPRLAAAPALGKADQETAWRKTARFGGWIDSTSGMASEARDSLEIGHSDGNLYLRYREPMPAEYLKVKTLLGGAMLKRSIAARDGNVWDDDCVEVRLTPDNGTTHYVLAVSASGAAYDARNGDTAFQAEDWIVQQKEDENCWAVEMRINLAALSGTAMPETWGVNVIRTVRQQGFSRRQWSFAADNTAGYARLTLRPGEAPVVSTDLGWSMMRGKLSVAVRGTAASPLRITSVITPLEHTRILPEDETINDVIRQAGRDKISPAVKTERTLPPGEIHWQEELDYVGGTVARAMLTVTDDAGTVLAAQSCLISGSELVSARLFNLPSRKEMVVQISLASETLAGADVTANITLTPDGGTAPVQRSTISGFAGMMAEATLDVAGVAGGPYQVEVVVEKKGTRLGTANRKWFKSGDPVWLGNDIGIIKTVPAPWSPVTKQGDSITVWGREHSFADSLLPAAMRIQGEDILAGPMRLLIKTSAGTLDTALTQTPAIAIDNAGLKATITGIATGYGLAVDVAGTLEFDGFAYLTFTLKPVDENVPLVVESIVFEAPFKKEYAELYDDSHQNLFATKSGRIPVEGMVVPATGTARVGDTRRGVQFYPFFDSIGKPAAAQNLTFTPEADAMRMRYVISEGVTLAKPVTTSVGLIGTPVKPFEANRIRLTGNADVPADLQAKGYAAVTFWFSTWTNFNGGSGDESGYFNYTPEWCRGFAQSMKKDWETKRRYALLKIQPGLITARSPEYALFWREWEGQYIDGVDEHICDLSQYAGAKVRPPGIWTGVDWTKRSWQDFFFYGLDKVLAAFAAEGVRVGIYVDCTDHHGDPRPYRQWVQRLYQVTRKYSPDGLIMIHMSGDRRMAIWGMADLLAEGEQYTANWSAYIADRPELNLNDCHPTVLPLDRMRATYAASLWGPQTVFLSQLWTDPRQQEDEKRKANGDPGPSYYLRMRYSTGLMLAHDAQFWGEFYACGVNEEPSVKRARWGYDETAEFIPYWDARRLLEIDGAARDTAIVSAWLRPDGKLMAVVLNTANAAATVRIKVNMERFPVKLPPFTKAVDITSPVPSLEPEAVQPATYPYQDGMLEVEMRARDFRLLVFE